MKSDPDLSRTLYVHLRNRYSWILMRIIEIYAQLLALNVEKKLWISQLFLANTNEYLAAWLRNYSWTIRIRETPSSMHRNHPPHHRRPRPSTTSTCTRYSTIPKQKAFLVFPAKYRLIHWVRQDPYLSISNSSAVKSIFGNKAQNWKIDVLLWNVCLMMFVWL